MVSARRDENTKPALLVEDSLSGLPLPVTGSDLGAIQPLHVLAVDENGNTGGWTPFRSIDLDETEEQIKASAGLVGPILAFNTTSNPLYLKFYNAIASNVTVGTTTPVMTLLIPGNADSDGAGVAAVTDAGWEFSTAITVACTTGIADSDTGAPGNNACVVNIGYK